MQTNKGMIIINHIVGITTKSRKILIPLMETRYKDIVLVCPHFIAVRSKAVILFWFYVACFWFQSLGDISPYVSSYYVKFSLGS